MSPIAEVAVAAKRIGCACEGHTLDRLLQPTVMALLTEGPSHGYALVDRLKDSPMMDGNPPDSTGVYRLLNRLQNEEMVSCNWSESDQGPSKRVYELTTAGRDCVAKWTKTLDAYRRNIARLVATLHEANL